MERLFDEKIIETAHFDVHQDWEVPIPAFLIIAPKRKLRSIAEFTDPEMEEFGRLLKTVRKGMRDALGIQEIYLFQNEDTEHNFHFWLFPRHGWMEPFGRKIQSVRPIMDHAKEHMRTEDASRAVHDSAEKMRAYLR